MPVGILTILIGEKFLPKDLTMSKKKIDWLGFATFALTIMSFLVLFLLGKKLVIFIRCQFFYLLLQSSFSSCLSK